MENYDCSKIVFLIGKGNNGADALSIARQLYRVGLFPEIMLIAPEKECSVELQKQIKMAKAYELNLSFFDSIDLVAQEINSRSELPILFEALFGTGIKLPLHKEYVSLFKAVNEKSEVIIAMDIPSGLHGDSGLVDPIAIKATETLAVGVPKLGQFIGAGPECCGQIVVVDGGFPPEICFEGERILIDRESALSLLPERSNLTHKYDYGHSLIIGGARGMTGAVFDGGQCRIKYWVRSCFTLLR